MMKFSQKRTCKNCQVAGEDRLCTVEKIDAEDDGTKWWHMYPKRPTSPCYKPMTYKEYCSFITTYQYHQRNETTLLELER